MHLSGLLWWTREIFVTKSKVSSKTVKLSISNEVVLLLYSKETIHSSRLNAMFSRFFVILHLQCLCLLILFTDCFLTVFPVHCYAHEIGLGSIQKTRIRSKRFVSIHAPLAKAFNTCTFFGNETKKNTIEFQRKETPQQNRLTSAELRRKV